MKIDRGLLRALCTAAAPSGFTAEVSDLIIRHAESCCDSVTQDKLGSVIACIKGKNGGDSRKLMIRASIDEAGAMINEVSNDGYLYFSLLGDTDKRSLCGKRATLTGEKGQIRGVVGAKPLHLLDKDERASAPDPSKIYIDIGAKDKEEAKKYVSVGDYAVFGEAYTELAGHVVSARAAYSRVPCAVLLTVMKALFESAQRPEYDVYFVFSSGGQTPAHGSVAAAYTLAPTEALLVDCTEAKEPIALDKGMVVALSGEGRIFYDREMTNALIASAERSSAPVQKKTNVPGASDSRDLLRCRGGIRLASLLLPCLGMYSGACTADIAQAEAAADILYGYITAE